MLSVCLLFTLHQFLMGSLLLVLLVCSWLDHQYCLCFFCSHSPHFMIGSVLFIFFLFVHQSCLFLSSSPLHSFWWDPCCLSFVFGLELFTNVVCVSWVHIFTVVDGVNAAYLFLFVLDLFTNVVCVSRVHPFTVFDGVHAAYLFLFVLDLFTNVVCVSRVHPLTVVDGFHASYLLYLVLTYSPMLSVSLEFTPSQLLMDPSCLSFIFGIELFTNVVCVSWVHPRSNVIALVLYIVYYCSLF